MVGLVGLVGLAGLVGLVGLDWLFVEIVGLVVLIGCLSNLLDWLSVVWFRFRILVEQNYVFCDNHAMLDKHVKQHSIPTWHCPDVGRAARDAYHAALVVHCQHRAGQQTL